ncbi:hypothetical protein CEXT_616491 [Caerostris extrusa]|uniref:Uncharacterized protein n=1 Tax=Caerostris extrusa TaxID=172846 RepID=A0AAV4X9J0_CAEEX|nr:hypothetical protein CEXT_616491 [Caerostris extrusa]
MFGGVEQNQIVGEGFLRNNIVLSEDPKRFLSVKKICSKNSVSLLFLKNINLVGITIPLTPIFTVVVRISVFRTCLSARPCPRYHYQILGHSL